MENQTYCVQGLDNNRAKGRIIINVLSSRMTDDTLSQSYLHHSHLFRCSLRKVEFILFLILKSFKRFVTVGLNRNMRG